MKEVETMKRIEDSRKAISDISSNGVEEVKRVGRVPINLKETTNDECRLPIVWGTAAGIFLLSE